MIVSFFGIDGAGKTTLSKGVVEKLSQRGIKSKYFYVGDWFLLSWVVKLLHFFYNFFKQNDKVKQEENPFLGTSKKPLLLQFWVLFTIVDNFLNYLRLLFYSCLSYVVVCDRYFYDKLVGFEYHGYSNKLLSWLYLKLTPTPDITFILDLDEKTSQRRETHGSHPLEFYKQIRKKYHQLQKMIKCRVIDVGNKQKNQVLEEVLSFLYKKIDVENKDN